MAATLQLDPLVSNSSLLEQAALRCREQLSSDPNNGALLRSLAEVYRKLGNLDEAAPLYERLVSLDPEDQDAAYLHAVLAGKPSPVSPRGRRPTPFVWLKDFLPRELHEALLPYALSIRDRFASSRVGRHAEYKPDVRQTLEVRGPWEYATSFRPYLEKVLPDVLPRLYLAPFEIEKYTIRLRAYQDGHFFRIHMDAEPHAQSFNRVINFVYYFHRLPRPYSGGDLLLYDSDIEANTFTTSRFTRVVPENNSIILFPCNFYHSVVPVRCPSKEFVDSRFVINGHISKCVPASAPAETTMLADSDQGGTTRHA